MKIDFTKCHIFLVRNKHDAKRLAESALNFDGKFSIGVLTSQTSMEPLLLVDGDTIAFAYKEFGDPNNYFDEDAIIKITDCKIIREEVKLDTAAATDGFFVRVSFSGAFNRVGKQDD